VVSSAKRKLLNLSSQNSFQFLCFRK
jgi:hypothetical protein